MGVSDEGFVPRSIHPCIHYVHLIDSDMKCLHWIRTSSSDDIIRLSNNTFEYLSLHILPLRGELLFSGKNKASTELKEKKSNDIVLYYVHSTIQQHLHERLRLATFTPIELRSTFYSFLSTNCATCVCENDFLTLTLFLLDTVLKHALQFHIFHFSILIFLFRLFVVESWLK
jgi:hypothetical protein